MEKTVIRIADLAERGGLVYLATPFSKHPNGHGVAYRQAVVMTCYLVEKGIATVSPIVHGYRLYKHMQGRPSTAVAWEAINSKLMLASKYIMVGCLPGWQNSDGIRDEIDFMKSWTIPFYLFPENIPDFAELVNKVPD